MIRSQWAVYLQLKSTSTAVELYSTTLVFESDTDKFEKLWFDSRNHIFCVLRDLLRTHYISKQCNVNFNVYLQTCVYWFGLETLQMAW